MRHLELRVVSALVLAVVLAAPVSAAPKKPKPTSPPDTGADCTFAVEASVPDYLVLATLDLTVRCSTVKQSITVTASEFTRDGVAVPLIPYDTARCTGTSVCGISIDLFSYDNHPVAFPGDQRYCARGSGVVGGSILGPAAACENDPRI